MKLMLLILVAFVSPLNLSGCGPSTSIQCADEVKSELKSPDGAYVATLYERDCGATTDFSTIVNLRESSAAFNGDDSRIFIVKGQRQVNLVWQEARSLHVECPGCKSDDIYKQEKSWRNVNISY